MMEIIEKDAKIYVAGHKGMVGSALVRALRKKGHDNFLLRSHRQLDLTRQEKVESFFGKEKPEYVFLAAAKVGGIASNMKQPADFLMENLQIQLNVLRAALQCQVKKLLMIGSSCVYPMNAPQPLRENSLLSGAPDPSNEGYAIAKITGLKLCEMINKQYHTRFISVMPPNLYGPHDKFEPERAHMVPALIHRMHEAKVKNLPEIEIWGTGTQCREFMYADDMAEACLLVMEKYEGLSHINIGTGREHSVKEIAEIIQRVVGYQGNLFFNANRPEGRKNRLLQIEQLMNLGWHLERTLEEGIEKTYQWYLQSLEEENQVG